MPKNSDRLGWSSPRSADSKRARRSRLWTVLRNQAKARPCTKDELISSPSLVTTFISNLRAFPPKARKRSSSPRPRRVFPQISSQTFDSCFVEKTILGMLFDLRVLNSAFQEIDHLCITFEASSKVKWTHPVCVHKVGIGAVFQQDRQSLDLLLNIIFTLIMCDTDNVQRCIATTIHSVDVCSHFDQILQNGLISHCGSEMQCGCAIQRCSAKIPSVFLNDHFQKSEVPAKDQRID